MHSAVFVLGRLRERLYLYATHGQCAAALPRGMGHSPFRTFITIFHMSLINLLKTPSGWDSALCYISQSSSLSPGPTGISAPICVTLFTNPCCQNLESLSLPAFPLPSLAPFLLQQSVLGAEDRGAAWTEITFTLHAHSNSAQTNLICCF